ncbi:hypothetical protein HYS93_00835 [Candidatus Daviesbacteria bacterium]|nr:hypothetical protein [Candidatus Daviesbacteria bacterium]
MANLPKQKGYIQLILLMLLFLAILIIWPVEIPTAPVSSSPIITEGCKVESGSTQVDAYRYSRGGNNQYTKIFQGSVDLDTSTKIKYQLVLSNVYVATNYLNENLKEPGVDNQGIAVDFGPQNFIDIPGRGKFLIMYPKKHGEVHLSNGGAFKFQPSTIGLIFLAHLNSDNSPKTFDGGSIGYKRTFMVTDVYQAVDKLGSPVPPEAIKECQGLNKKGVSLPSPGAEAPKLIFPNQDVSQDKEELQLQYFLLQQDKLAIAGAWNVHCKPAVYLYPKQATVINVKIDPKVDLTYTDPLYPLSGWNATAYPDGKLIVDNKEYPYLYYEAKIEDKDLNKPDQGFVVTFDKLPVLFDDILPKLGLNSKETQQFKDYWLNALPNSSYYFVGIVDQKQIDQIEPLYLTPKPDQTIRVHLYFQALDKPTQVTQPILITPKREGFSFTMVEWGGLVKTDPLAPFTCSQ